MSKNVPILVGKKRDIWIAGFTRYWQPRNSQQGSEILLSGSSKIRIVCCSVKTASCVLVTVFRKTGNVRVK